MKLKFSFLTTLTLAFFLSLLTALGFSVFAYFEVLRTNSGTWGSASDWALVGSFMSFFYVLFYSFIIYLLLVFWGGMIILLVWKLFKFW